MVGLLASLVLLGSLTVWRLSRDAATDVHTFVGETMGTSYHVTVDAELSTRDQGAVREVIAARLERVNRLMSTYDSTSELSRLNRHDGPEPFPVSRELLEVLTMAREVSERSGGAFDVTVAPLVEAWGFGPAGRPARRPDERELGYGVESVASGLRGLGLTRFLVEVGGEVKAVGTRSDGRAWRVGVESPDEAVRSVFGVVGLTDESLATSGDYRNFYEQDGVRYAHVIDPRTGSPVRYHGSSVSVAHPNAAKADAWATALTVLGPDAGYDLARREDVAALFVMRANGEFQSRATPLFSERLDVSEKTVR
jgi:thiamine biosynthesis lipoprotein